MKATSLAVAATVALFFASSVSAQNAARPNAPDDVQTSGAAQPAEAPPVEAAPVEDPDPVVCRRVVERTTSRLQRQSDRRCLRRSEWTRLQDGSQDSVSSARETRQGSSRGN
jgi:hypothetical protein